MSFEVTYSVVVFAALTLFSALSLIMRKPFSLWFAHERTPEEFWDTPLFLETNMMLTGTWTLLFIASALACGLGPWWTPIATAATLFIATRLSGPYATWYAELRTPVEPESRESQ